jgi:hypothetical protein
MTMATDNTRFLAGNPKHPEGGEVPNITPDKTTGLAWTLEEIAEYLGTGNKPDGDVAGGLMAEVIQGTTAGYKDLTKDDRPRDRGLHQVGPADPEQDREVNGDVQRSSTHGGNMKRRAWTAVFVMGGLTAGLLAGCASR